MHNLVKDLTSQDIACCFEHWSNAVQAHISWMHELHAALLIGSPAAASLFRSDGFTVSGLANWYYQGGHPVLRNYQEFALIDGVYRRLCAAARRMLSAVSRGGRPSDGDYRAFFAVSEELQRLIAGIELKLKQDLLATVQMNTRILEATGEAVVITDARGVITDVNGAFQQITGYSRTDVDGSTPAILASGRHGPEFYAEMWRAIQTTGAWQGEIWNRRKNGEVYPEWLSITTLSGEDGGVAHYLGVFSDLTVAKRNEDRLYRLAYHDPLTGLANRPLVLEQLKQSIARASRNRNHFAVMFIDLDRFKRVNDTLGHNAGDMLLRDVAERLKSGVRATDTVGRLGGDEFVIILENLAGQREAATIAEKLLERMAVPFLLSGTEVFTSASVGIALYPTNGLTVEGLVKAADMAMYHAKEEGRNTFRFFQRETQGGIGEQFALEHALWRALERDELRVVYQPQVDLNTGRILGMEALLRWLHPERGVVEPEEFIPIAEATGLIIPIGAWVLEHACTQVRQWQDEGFAVQSIAVNVSGRQLRQRDFAEQVVFALDKSRLDPEVLEIEITESSVMQNAEFALGLLQQLKSIGVRVSIDDFGRGYSSLSYLKRFPIDAVKIDRSFVHGIACDANDQAISRGIIALGEELGLRVVAEGVESEEQVGWLRQFHCTSAQGFLFSHPVPAEDAVGLLFQG